MLKYACEQQGGKCIITYVLLGAGVCGQACLCENGIGSIVASSPTVRTTNVLFRATRFSLKSHRQCRVLTYWAHTSISLSLSILDTHTITHTITLTHTNTHTHTHTIVF